jgi:hypothetical protein
MKLRLKSVLWPGAIGRWLLWLGGVVAVVVALSLPAWRRTCPPGPRSPLLRAVRADDLARVTRLLAQGADPNRGRVPFNTECPLDVALQRENPKMVALLLAHGAKTRAALADERRLDMERRSQREISPR